MSINNLIFIMFAVQRSFMMVLSGSLDEDFSYSHVICDMMLYGSWRTLRYECLVLTCQQQSLICSIASHSKSLKMTCSDWSNHLRFAFGTCRSLGVRSACVVVSQPSLDTPQTMLCFRPCRGENGFKPNFPKPNTNCFQTIQFIIPWWFSFPN